MEGWSIEGIQIEFQKEALSFTKKTNRMKKGERKNERE